jgi:Tfp pilus assembly protein PilP
MPNRTLQQRIRNVLRSVVPSGQRPDKQRIADLTASLMQFEADAYQCSAAAAPYADDPKAQKDARDKLSDLAAQLERVGGCLDSEDLSQAAINALAQVGILRDKDPKGDLAAWSRSVLGVAEKVREAQVGLNRRRGRPRKLRERGIAITGLRAFEELSGGRATVSVDNSAKAYGRFFDFLSALFEAIDGNTQSANIQYMANVAIEAATKPTTPTTQRNRNRRLTR